MPAIPQQRIRGQSRPPLLVKWNWARKPLENPLCGFNASEGQLPSIPSVSNLPAAHGPALGGRNDRSRSTPSFSIWVPHSLTAAERMRHPEFCWPAQMLQDTEQDSLQHHGANFLADHQVCFGPLPTYPIKGHKAAPALQQPHSCKQAEPGAYIKLSHS